MDKKRPLVPVWPKPDSKRQFQKPKSSGDFPPGLMHLYDRYWSDLCAYLRASFGKGPPEPEDIAQLAFVQIASRGNYATIDNPRAFLWRTARNIAVSEGRTRQMRQKYDPEVNQVFGHSPVDSGSPENTLIAREQIALIRDALSEMSATRRTVFLLHRLDGLSYAEISRRVGLSPTAIKNHVARAMAAIDVALMSLGE